MTTYRMPGLVLTDHTISAPLDHTKPEGEQISVFGREVVAADKVSASGEVDTSLPWLVYLQGGPGFSADRPSANPGGWLGRALADYRVLLLDQRGTGRSTPATRQSLTHRGSAQAQADYLRHFRADSIARDAELMRRSVAGVDTQWASLGQSFGGFITMTYLSIAPEGLSESFITGGLPGLPRNAEEVYRATYPRVAEKNAAYF